MHRDIYITKTIAKSAICITLASAKYTKIIAKPCENTQEHIYSKKQVKHAKGHFYHKNKRTKQVVKIKQLKMHRDIFTKTK